jgi:hypothetical protein
MAYIINKFSGEQLIVLEDGTIDTSTSLGLVGRNYVGYGETQNENFIYLLENFANNDPPQRPLAGQIWFDTDTKLANIYDGTAWNPIGVKVSDVEPVDTNTGSLWLDTISGQLKIYNGVEWGLVGPEAVAGFGITRARSTSLNDIIGNAHPVIFFEIDDVVIAIGSSEAFTINPTNAVPRFANALSAGITMAAGYGIEGNLIGNASSADKLSSARLINGVPFDGLSDITIKASTTNKLIKGTYILGSDFDGTTPITWSVDASSANQIGKVVARNSTGGFSAGTITANLVGDVTGNVTAASGISTFDTVQATIFVGATLTGNANSATQLANPRQINGVAFDGTTNITVTAAASTLTGNTLNSTVTQSSLISLGTLNSLFVADAGISIGSAGTLKFLVESARPTLRSTSGTLNFDMGVSGPDISFVDAATALSLGGPNAPAIIGDNTTNLGINGFKFNNIYANNLFGNADTATSAITATNLAGGGPGAIPFQTANNSTSMLGLGAAGTVLTAGAGGLSWQSVSREPLSKGSFLTLVNTTTSGALDNYDGVVGVTIAVDATSANTASKVVARDANGNFVAGTITANLTGNVTGNVTGNSGTATRLQTSRTINGVSFDGTANITIEANDPNSGAPVGAILYYPSATIPVGWMICDGASISTTAFSLLFSKIGYTYGGSGSLFRLPDLRGEFIRSWDGGRGIDSGRGLGSTQKGTIQVVDPNYGSHNVQGIIGRNNYPGGTTGVVDPQFNIESGMDYVSRDDYPNVMLSYVGANVPLNLGTSGFGFGAARPRNVALVACIKVFGQIDEPDQVAAAAIINYVNSVPKYQIISGASASIAGFTNQVGSWNFGANFFDVFPPTGKSMGNLVAFIPSINQIHFAGGVNGDDSMVCTYSYLSDRIRVYVQNTEQRSTPAANYLVVWGG